MHITDIRIEGIRGFGSDDLAANLNLMAAGEMPRWVVVAGRNGAGKSTFLRAVALAVVGPNVGRVLAETFAGWVRDGSPSGSAAVRLAFNEWDSFAAGRRPLFTPWAGVSWTRQEDGPEPLARTMSVGGNWSPARGPWAENFKGWFLAGYGPFRRLSPAPTEAQRMMMSPGRLGALVSLFREDASLAESVLWLQQIYLRRLEKKSGAAELEYAVLALLRDGLLPEGMTVERVDSDGLWVHSSGSDTDLPLQALSDGYRTVAALVLDIVKQILDNYGEVTFREGPAGCAIFDHGVILIDEIDVHLHVSWQQRIGFWLKDHFPNMQFIVSTHSPFICQAADPGGLIRLSPPSSDEPPSVISGELFNRIVNGSADDAVISDLFGLETAYSSQSKGLREELATLEGGAQDMDGQQKERRITEIKEQLPTTGEDEVSRLLGRLSAKLEQ